MDSYCSLKEAAFRRGYATIDHLQVIKTLIEKSAEYNKPLLVIFVDYQKVFDTSDEYQMLQNMTHWRIDHRYTRIIKNIYEIATEYVSFPQGTGEFRMKRCVQQGDPMP